ncbi:DNA repair protein RecN [Nocardioides sp.]|uniref:DNA repair protein RecN n=1 Tax=Nocardioides sp. TaxID=35761 RepID=UPI002ED0D983
MLEEIRIGSLGVIDSSDLELGPGLTVITGETGAGKTMIVTALGLLLGGRADSGAVRTGARMARVEGTVVVDGLHGLDARVDEVGGELEDRRVVLGRTVSAEGRSRAFVGGASVPVSRLADLAAPLVAMHGQSDQHRLLRPGAQRDAVDAFGGEAIAEPLARYRSCFEALREAERELTDVTTNARERAREADLLRFGVGEVDAVSPSAGEDTELAAEEARLGHADTLRSSAEEARSALSTDDIDQPDALGLTASARTALDGVREHDPEVAGLADRVAEVSYLLSDLAADVASYASSIETDPARLAAVSERRAALTALTRKYGDTLDEVLAWRDRAAERLTELDGTDERIEELRGVTQRLRSELAEVGTELSAARRAAGERLSATVTEELAALAMPHARLSVSVTERDEHGASGKDRVELLLAANVGADPRPLGKGASGGELSRVMLALEVSLAGTTGVPTYVFDEVDAGVGGASAVEVGRRLARLARTAQVLVVTHLPQVAAFADRHVVVSKSDDGTVTSADLTVLDDSGRERELSRMMAGQSDSDNALAHARELLEAALPARAQG